MVPWRLAPGYVPPRNRAAVTAGHRHRRDPQLRSHSGRIWRGADGGREHCGRHAHGFDLDLRPGAGAQLWRGAADLLIPARRFFHGAGADLRAAAPGLAGMAGELTCRCRKRLASGFELDAALRIPVAESPVTVLFGPSGSGKTTLLRLLAGLELPDEGIIAFQEATWCDISRQLFLPPQQRRAGFLFQDYALFPHLTVAENVAFAATPEAAGKLLDRFGLAEFAGRLPRALSGGQH